MLKDTTEEQQAAERERINIGSQAQELISSPIKFANEIIEKPASKDDAKRHLNIDQDAVAFWHIPEKGEGAKNTYLAFTKISLLRLLRRVSMGDDLLDAFLHQCEQAGLLNKRSHNIKLGKDTLNIITFHAEEL